MNTTSKVITYELSDVLRSRWVVLYALFFLLMAEALLRFGGSGPKALLSLVNVVLILIPLVSILFGTLYLYNARAFIELLLSQPVDRRSLFAGMYGGLAAPLALGFAVGVGLPFLWHGMPVAPGALAGLLVAGVWLTFIFVALAFLIAVYAQDRVKGIGMALLVWLACSILYDGLVLMALSAFAAYPLDTPALILMLFNPVDLVRVVLMMQFDISAMMGYTGAVFQRFLGTGLGLGVAALALSVWLFIPLSLGLRRFRRRDF